MPNSFIVVLTPLAYSGPLPLEILPGFRLDRPTAAQLERLKPSLLFSSNGIQGPEWLYEFAWQPHGDGAQGTRQPSDRWNYFVINYEGRNDRSGELDLALDLNVPSVETGPDFAWVEFPVVDASGEQTMHGELSPVSRQAATFSFFDTHWPPVHLPVAVSSESFSKVPELFSLCRSRRLSHPDLMRIADRLSLVKTLPRGDQFFLLSHFAIIEALITHNPHDQFDSLTHQVAHKMNLLKRRFFPTLDESAFPITPKKGEELCARVWKHLYGFRSRIAHGATLDSVETFRALGSRELVWSYVQEATRRVLVSALMEPDFVEDLKAC